MAGEEGTGQVTGQGTGQVGGEWRAQLPSDLKENEAFLPHKTVGDFAKAHLETAGKVKEYEGKVKDFEGRLANSIPKLTDKSTDEEKTAHRKALGVPDKPEEYEFPKGEGIEHSEQMTKWAQGVFHKAALSKEQAVAIGQDWDTFLQAMVKEEDRMVEEAKIKAEAEFKKQFKNDEEYKGAIEGVARFFKKVSGADKDYFNNKFGNDPFAIRFIYEIAKKTGEDLSPKGTSVGRVEASVGLTYPNSPQPPNQEVR